MKIQATPIPYPFIHLKFGTAAQVVLGSDLSSVVCLDVWAWAEYFFLSLGFLIYKMERIIWIMYHNKNTV